MAVHFGMPDFMNTVVVLNMFMAFSAFILAIIAVAAPAWVTFVDSNNTWYGIGLFSSCKENVCGYAWNLRAQTQSLTDGLYYTTWYYTDSTPTLIVCAQAFFLLGIFVNMFTFCFWVGGSTAAAISTMFPAIFYTVGFSCAASYFIQNSSSSGLGILYGASWDYAAACAVACVALVWLSFFIFIVDAIYRAKRDRQIVGEPEIELPMKDTDTKSIEADVKVETA